MNRPQTQDNQSRLLPYPVIMAAVGGDVDALNVVLKHYEGYILVLATRRMFDDYGNVHYVVDEALRQELQSKLMTNILNFRAA